MADDETQHGPDAEAGADAVDEAATPPTGGFSRRRFLAAIAAVGGTAAAGAVLWQVLGDDDDGGDDKATSSKAPAPKLNAAGDREVRTLHFAMGSHEGLSSLAALHVGAKMYPLVAHGEDSTAGLLTADPHLSKVKAGHLTHYVESVELPVSGTVQCALLDQTTSEGYATPDTKYLGTFLHVPTNAVSEARQKQAGLSKAVVAYGLDAKVRTVVDDAAAGLASHAQVAAAVSASTAKASPVIGGSAAHYDRKGLAAADHPTTLAAAQAYDDVVDPMMATAIALTMKHPEILRQDAPTAALVLEIVKQSGAVSAFADKIQQVIEGAGGSTTTTAPDPTFGGTIGTFQPVLDPDTGKPVTIRTDVTDPSGKTPPQQPLVVMKLVDDLQVEWGEAAIECIGLAKASEELEKAVWIPYQSIPPTVNAPAPAATVGAGEAELDVTLSGEGTQGTSYGFSAKLKKVEPETNTVVINVGNDYLRHLMMAVHYSDDSDNGVPLTGEYGGSAPWKYTDDSTYLGALELVPSVPAPLGITIPGANSADIELVFPQGAKKATVFALGPSFRFCHPGELDRIIDKDGNKLYGNRFQVPMAVPAWICTLILDFAVPALLLYSDVSEFMESSEEDEEIFHPAKAWSDEDLAAEFNTVEKLIAKSQIGAVAIAAVTGAATVDLVKGINWGDATMRFVKDIATELVHIMMSTTLLKPLVEKLLEKILAEEFIKAIPFVGEVMAAMGVIENVTKLATSTVELSIAPAVQVIDVVPSYTANITLTPDENDSVLPRSARWFSVLYRAGSRQLDQVVEGSFNDGPDSLKTYTIHVADVPIGGEITWEVSLLTKKGGYLVGKASSKTLDNSPFDAITTDIELQIIEQLIPITPQTTVARKGTTDAAGGTVKLAAISPVDGTVASLVRSNPDRVGQLGDISVATRIGAVGYTWSTNGKWYVRNVSFAGDPMTGWNTTVPFDRRPHLVYDSLTSDLAGTNHYLLDPLIPASGSDPTEGLIVRQVAADLTPNMGLDRTKSVGRFPMDLTDVAFNPHGYLVGVDTSSARLSLLKLADEPVPDLVAPMAGSFSGPGARQGLMRAPVRVACRVDGTVLVLDATIPTVFAFGLDGNPAPIFAGGATKVDLTGLAAHRIYPGFSCDGGNYLYLVSYGGAGTVDDYRLDAFDPEGGPAFSVKGVNVGGYAVDYWRNGYGLNYRLLGGPGAKPYRDPKTGAVEPSVSDWIPDTP